MEHNLARQPGLDTVEDEKTGYENILEEFIGQEDGLPVTRRQVGVTKRKEGKISQDFVVIPTG